MTRTRDEVALSGLEDATQALIMARADVREAERNLQRLRQVALDRKGEASRLFGELGVTPTEDNRLLMNGYAWWFGDEGDIQCAPVVSPELWPGRNGHAS